MLRIMAALQTRRQSFAKRVLVWHPFMHTINSVMKGRIDSANLMEVVGHRQESTNLLYSHALPKGLEDVRELQESLIG